MSICGLHSIDVKALVMSGFLFCGSSLGNLEKMILEEDLVQDMIFSAKDLTVISYGLPKLIG